MLKPENQPKTTGTCPSPEISAYIDDELEPEAIAGLEKHLAECAECRMELNRQKSFLGFLNGTLEHDDVPLDAERFTRSVVVNAESRVQGLRSSRERLVAALVCVAVLAVAAGTLALFGGPFENDMSGIVDQGSIIARTVGNVLFSIGFGVAVIVRSLTSDEQAGRFALISLLIAAVLAFFVLRNLSWRSRGRDSF